MKTPEEIKKGIVEAIEEVSWVVEDGDAHDLQDACDKAHASMADALALIEQLEAQVPKWISYKEKSPQEAGDYLVHCIHLYSDTDGYECYKVACFDPKILWVNIGNLLKVTHWMPLLEPPKEE